MTQVVKTLNEGQGEIFIKFGKKKLTTDYIYDANSPPIVQLNKAHLMTKMKMTWPYYFTNRLHIWYYNQISRILWPKFLTEYQGQM